ncbi:hypothetical protein GMDG_05248 [Pseudogymnoascus destructans 20631-21]|uniref:R3H-associated N-terminal domain-containing protein n=1 Tax=Pseudogymnoascus destructans (strain ATCC MYA-4855 / 20631-21) TaxID=658429 RepID=L8FNR9_PSED2|nr:hypothetical protein GMDG_05248 [Pseudogymnoascus destructans 20631-21]
MAIYSSVPPPNQQASVDIETWTLHALQHLDITPLQIPLHDDPADITTTSAPAPKPRATTTTASKPKPAPSKRRELAEKGKEGSRRRKRWENDRLIGVPGVVAPSSRDWEVHSSSPVRRVPYYLAPLWEGVSESRRSENVDKEEERGRVPSELRERIRRGKVEGEMLRHLECEVRRFVVEWEVGARPPSSSRAAGAESSDEEVVFVGRDLSARTMREREEERRAKIERERERERCVFEARVGDEGGGAGGGIWCMRWRDIMD